jgi:hypothetical protein
VIDVTDYLQTVEAQLAELTERGAHRRLRARVGVPVPRRGSAAGAPAGGPGSGARPPRLRADLLAVGAAAAVTAAVVAIVIGIGGGPHHGGRASRTAHQGQRPAPAHHVTRRTQPSVPSRHPSAPGTGVAVSAPAGPVPAGFAPESFTAIGDFTWWLLGTAPCSSPPCTSIVRTDNGGRSFVGIPAPRTSQVSQLRFADPENGFAYGPQLWVTHDAGASWHELDLGSAVTDVSIGGGYVYAIVTPTSRTGPGRLVRSPLSADRWVTLPAAGDAYAGLWVHDADVLLQSGTARDGGSELLVSSDAGATFTSHPSPVAGLPCDFEEPAPPVVWAHCATGMMSGVWRSTDGGQRFQPTGGQHSWPGPEMPNSAAFGAASATTAVVGYQQLYRTTDGGASYARIAGPTGITWWRYLAFTDPTHGVALGFVGNYSQGNERLYYTTDGGLSYHLVTIG